MAQAGTLRPGAPVGARPVTKLELRVPPPAVLAICAAATAAAGHWLPAANLPFPGHRPLAVALVVAGMSLALAGVMAFRSARTTVNPFAPEKATSIVKNGVFRWTRNPMYLGMAAGLLGVASWWATLPGLLFLAAFCAYITRFQIRPEERVLRARFGDEFIDYMARVRRWL